MTRQGIHFVVPPTFVDEVTALPDRMLGQDYPYWLGGRFNWVAQAWLVLRQFREGLTISTTPKSGSLNFGHVMAWRNLPARQGEFRISIRADYPRLFDADFEILQNPACRTGKHQAYLPYWPVPGLIPRDSTRRGVRTVAYAGRLGPLNLADGLHAPKGPLEQFDFRIISPDHWHDLSEIDVLLAIRSFDRAEHSSKPPSKLYSACRAEIPLIAGYDSAFSSIAEPGREYLRVDSIARLTNELRQLKNDPAYYNSIVQAGRARAPEFSHEAIAQVWLECLDTKIIPAFNTWQARGGPGLLSATYRAGDSLRKAGSALKRGFSARRH